MTGIEAEPEWPGLIPRYYEIAACHRANHTYHGSWQALSATQRAELVAHYVLENLIASHKGDAETSDYEKRQRKKGRS